MTTTWSQVCSTSASWWLETTHRASGGRVPAEHLAHLADLRRIQAVRRLVEHEQVRQPQHRLRDREPLAHALAVGLHPAVHVVAEAGDLQRLVQVGVLRRPPGRAPEQPQVLQPRHVRQEPRSLDERADPREHRGAGADRVPEDHDPALRRRDQPHEHPQRRRLAGAVRAEQAEHPPPLDAERHVAHRAEAVGVPLAQTLHRERDAGELGLRRPGPRAPAEHGEAADHESRGHEQGDRPRHERAETGVAAEHRRGDGRDGQ